jgi:hypothetical protein
MPFFHWLYIYSEPWKELIDAIIGQRGRIEVKHSDLEGRNIQHPLYRMLFILVKSNGAVDWLNGTPLDTKQSGPYSIHNHHIFPASRLRKERGYDSENHLHNKIVNEIANRAYLQNTPIPILKKKKKKPFVK